jgi:sugar (pentulose or hexulose) kinase
MAIVLGIDLGTSKITALALDTASGDVLASTSMPTAPETTAAADREHGFHEWDACAIAGVACRCLREVSAQLAGREFAGLGITGQQHGVVLVDAALTPLTPFINWQDKRAASLLPEALDRAGQDAPLRTGCRLAAGYMGLTLFWMKRQGLLPADGTACFLMDYFAALLTGHPPLTDPTCAASSGLLDVSRGIWDAELLAALELPASLFPPVRTSGEVIGGLTQPMAQATGLPAGLPICIGIGDNQASFVGSVGKPAGAVLVNVGTGGQVAAFSDRFIVDPLLETRPFPRGGFLLVSAGLSGGAAYAVLERFFRQAGADLFHVDAGDSLYVHLNRLAEGAPLGAGGIICEPFFSGTRAHPEWRASWSGISVENFTPACVTRALLEGMARAFRTGYERMGKGATRLVGAGNGLRENPLLARIVSDAFRLPLSFPRHRDEAACGAALVAAAGLGLVGESGGK